MMVKKKLDTKNVFGSPKYAYSFGDIKHKKQYLILISIKLEFLPVFSIQLSLFFGNFFALNYTYKKADFFKRRHSVADFRTKTVKRITHVFCHLPLASCHHMGPSYLPLQGVACSRRMQVGLNLNLNINMNMALIIKKTEVCFDDEFIQFHICRRIILKNKKDIKNI